MKKKNLQPDRKNMLDKLFAAPVIEKNSKKTLDQANREELKQEDQPVLKIRKGSPGPPDDFSALPLFTNLNPKGLRYRSEK